MLRKASAHTLPAPAMLISWPLLVLPGLSMFADYRSAVSIADEAYGQRPERPVVVLVSRPAGRDHLDIEVDPRGRRDPCPTLRTRSSTWFSTTRTSASGDPELLHLPWAKLWVCNHAGTERCAADKQRARWPIVTRQSDGDRDRCRDDSSNAAALPSAS